MSLGMMSSAFITLLFAVFPIVDYQEIIKALRGLCEGVILPALTVMISKWSPPEERAKIAAFVYSGAAAGVYILTDLIYPILEGYPLHPTFFYVYGGSGFVWLAFWLVFCYDKPEDHPYMSQKERDYLESFMKVPVDAKSQCMPYGRMLTSLPLWALVIASVGHEWGLRTVTDYLPRYNYKVLGIKYDSSWHYVVMWVCCLVTSCVADLLVSIKFLSITNVRKLGATIASVLPAGLLISTTYVNTWTELSTMSVLSFSLLLGFGIPSLKVNTLDLCSKHSGTVMALCNIAAVTITRFLRYIVPSSVLPYVISRSWDDGVAQSPLKYEFSRIFWTTSGVLMVTFLFYLIFASGNDQKWSVSKKTEEGENCKKREENSEDLENQA